MPNRVNVFQIHILQIIDVGSFETKINGHPLDMAALSLESYLLKTANFPSEASTVL